MRFERITIERFGGLTGFDTGETPLRPLVAVCGPNEAGKSSLFTFLTSILYGFYPASRDQNPYSPWSGGEIEGSALIRLSDDRLWEVHRRLLAAPWGRLAENGRVENIRNQSLEIASRVPREVFRRIYALTLSDLSGLEGKSWEAVQDRLMGSMGASDIIPPREAAKQLEDEANALWRPDRRGTPRAKELEEELQELRGRRAAAREADRTVREKVETLAEVTEELREAREERERCRHLRERIETLDPVRQRLLRIDELRERVGPPEALEGLPADPRALRSELEEEMARLEGRLRRLVEEEREPRARAQGVTERDSRLLAHRESIGLLTARHGEILHAESRRSDLEARLRDAGRACEDEARELFSVPWERLAGGDVEAAVERVPVGSLRAAIRNVREAAEETRRWAAGADAGERARGPTSGGAGSRSTRLQPVAGVLFVTLGLLLFLGAEPDSPIRPVGVVALFAGAMLLAVWEGERRAGVAGRTRDEMERRETAALHREAAAKEDAARARLDELLDELPLRDAHRKDPGPELAEAIARLQAQLQEGRGAQESRQEIAGHMGEIRAALRHVQAQVAGADAGATPEPEPGAAAAPGHAAGSAHRAVEGAASDSDPVRDIPLLDHALRQAGEAAGAAAQAERELARIGRERVEAEEALAACRARIEALDGRLETIGGGDLHQGMERAVERLEARRDADLLEADLEHTHPDLDALRTRIAEAEAAGESWVIDEETRAVAAAREAELSLQVEELSARAKGLEHDIAHMGERETVDAVEGAIREVREEIGRLARERDRRIVLARLLRTADRSFREAHQPDIIRRAAGHMESITEGRYGGLSIGEEDRERVFYLHQAGHARPLPVDEPISTGTREQFYLALRLAIVDHLDAGGERLPLFMDEAFVNWDRDRRSLGFDLLEKLSAERQIFVFTCHEAMADELEARGAGTVRLGERRPDA